MPFGIFPRRPHRCEVRRTPHPARMIFKARELLLRSAPDESPQQHRLIDQMTALGWGVLAETPGREIVMGAVTEPWEPACFT